MGVTTIDTAPVYGMGYSEEIVAKALKGRRDKVVIATKCGLRWDSTEGSDPWEQKDRQGNPITIFQNSKPDSIAYECEQSLKRLGVDAIDLLQIHWPDTTTAIEDSWQAMAKLKKQGKVKAIGVSNYSLQQLKQAHAVHPVDSIQSPYSLLRRGLETDIVPFCQKNGISVLAYSPLERGLLTGSITKERVFKGDDHRKDRSTFSLENREIVLEALQQIKPIAEAHQATVTQVIIHTTFERPGITAALVGARNRKQATENAKSLSLQLSAAERELVAKILWTSRLQQVAAV
jgi:aryl-alcohol dehydrogenase-like predicted oxidoreductase